MNALNEKEFERWEKSFKEILNLRFDGFKKDILNQIEKTYAKQLQLHLDKCLERRKRSGIFLSFKELNPFVKKIAIISLPFLGGLFGLNWDFIAKLFI